MGFFSWKTQDTDRSISNAFSDRGAFTVHMLDNKGNVYTEDNYEGYGIFGGKDFFELVAEMNGHKPDRNKGIDIYYGDEPFISPNLVEVADHKWVNRVPPDCEFQGYFYG